MPTSLEKMVTYPSGGGKPKVYRKSASPLADVLIALDHCGGVVQSKPGLASRILRDSCATEKVRNMTASGFSGLLGKLEEAGWVSRQINGKRTHEIRLLAAIPSDASDWLVFEGDESRVVGHRSKIQSPEAAQPTVEPIMFPDSVAALPEPEEPRSGRFAARLEKSLPETITTMVMGAIQADRDAQHAALGYWPTVDPARLAEMEATIESIEGTIARMQTRIDDVVAERDQALLMFDWYADMEDERLIRSNDGQVASKKALTANQVKDPLRGLARIAIEAGWTIQPTRGGHLLWRNPDKKAVFSASTSSAQNSVNIMRRKLRRAGLVVEGRTQESADVDRTHGWNTSTPNEGA